MQSRFKFRVWSGKENKYLTNDDIWKLSDALVEDVWGLLGEIEDPTTEYNKQHLKDYRLIFEQCTGLRDKNGKLIYEGDILATSTNSQSYGCYKVFFQKDECSFKVISCDGSYDYAIPLNVLTEKNDFQIIGNIHENPELLEE